MLSLCIEEFSVLVHIGVSDAERSSRQELLITVEMNFTEFVAGCYSDRLDDTHCYHDIITKITELSRFNTFKLVESFGYRILQLVKELVPKCDLIIKVKKKPLILNQKCNVILTICSL